MGRNELGYGLGWLRFSFTARGRKAAGAPLAQLTVLGRPVLTKLALEGDTMRNRTLRLSKTRTLLIDSLGAIAALSLGSSVGLAAGDRAAGQQFFTTHCSACHATEPGVKKVGPSLAGVFGRKSGSAPDYNYSPALKAANITWNANTLDKWLQSPVGDVHGARMFITVPNAGDRQNIIAYLESLK
jgi:cytochrome c